MAATDSVPIIKVLFTLHPGMDAMDFVGPLEVLTHARHNINDEGTSTIYIQIIFNCTVSSVKLPRIIVPRICRACQHLVERSHLLLNFQQSSDSPHSMFHFPASTTSFYTLQIQSDKLQLPKLSLLPSSPPPSIPFPLKAPPSALTWTSRKPTRASPNLISLLSPVEARTPSSNPNLNPSASSEPSPTSKRKTRTKNAPSSQSVPAHSFSLKPDSFPDSPQPHTLTSTRSLRRSVVRSVREIWRRDAML